MVRIQHGAENMKKIMSYIQKACLYDFRKISILSAIPMGGPFIVSKPYLNQLIPPPQREHLSSFPLPRKEAKRSAANHHLLNCMGIYILLEDTQVIKKRGLDSGPFG